MSMYQSQLTDFLTNTIRSYEKDRMVQTQERLEYPGFDLWQSGKSAKLSGTRHDWNVRMRAQNTTAEILYFDTVTPNVVWVMEQAGLGHHDSNQPIMWDIKELEKAQDEEQLVDTVDARYDAAMEDLVQYWDNLAFGTRRTASDATYVDGLSAMFPQLGVGVEDAVGGFNGQTIVCADGSTTTVYAGIDASLVGNARWRPWVMTRPADFNETVIRAIKKCISRTRFTTISKFRVSEIKVSAQSAIYVDSEDYEQATDIRNTGTHADEPMDLAPDGQVSIHGVPLKRAQALDTFANKPIFGKNGKYVQFIRQKGRWMRSTDAMTSPNAPDTRVIHIQNSGYARCLDRRRGGFRLHTVRAS